jgi:SulP family sulfate permease
MPENEAKGWWYRRVPALEALRSYSLAALGRDLIAGLTVATVAVPQAMAYALLAGLPPQYGLYTAIVMTAVGALFDSSRLLINGPTNAISIALLSALAVIPTEERVSAAIALAFLVGLIQLSIALSQLGDLSRFVSHSVIVGFTFGAATLLILDQAKHFLGLHTGGLHLPTVLVGVGTVAVVLAIRQVNRVLKRRGWRLPIPQHLVAIILMSLVVGVWHLDERGVAIVGGIPASLPGFRVPDLKWEQVRLLAGSAFAIALLGLLEAVAMAKAIAARTGQKLDVNQQCLSEGAANLAGSFFQCFPGSGSLTRSAVNEQTGAISQWSGVFAAVAVATTVLLFAPLAGYIPRASLAGLLVLAAYRMVDGKQLVFHLRATRFDAGVVLATAGAAVLISIEFCIVIGVFLSFALYVPRAARVGLTRLTVTRRGLHEERSGEGTGERVVAFALEGELFFGAETELVKHFGTIEQVARGDVAVVILCLRRARNADAAFLRLLEKAVENFRARGVTLVLCSVPADLTAALETTGVMRHLGADHLFAEEVEKPRGSEAVGFAFEIVERMAVVPATLTGIRAR